MVGAIQLIGNITFASHPERNPVVESPIDGQITLVFPFSVAYTDKQVKLMWSDATINPNLTLLEHEPDFQEVAGTTKIFGSMIHILNIHLSTEQTCISI